MQIVAEKTTLEAPAGRKPSSLRINKLGPHIGAEAIGVDLSRPIDEETRKRLNDAVVEHIALVIRGQTFTTAEQFLEAARVFGTVVERPSKSNNLNDMPLVHYVSSRDVDSTGTPKRTGEPWHTDHTNLQEPTNYTMLYPVELPEAGGRTFICSMHAAYRALPEDLKQRVKGLQTVNIAVGSASVSRQKRGKADSLARQAANPQAPAIHPLVRTHPANGNKALYFNPSKLENIVGMTPDESQDFIEMLTDVAVKPEFVYTHEHRMGDMLIWDNRSSLHRADTDYKIVGDRHRVLFRIIAAPEEPV